MIVKVLREAGYEEAMLGLSLSHHQPIGKMPRVAEKIKDIDIENKFLEFIDVWVDVTAPFSWWKQADTYRMTVKQSDSMMHNIHKAPITQSDFNRPIPENYLVFLNLPEIQRDIDAIQDYMPAGYLQRRIWKLNYKNIRWILMGRTKHRLKTWREVFCVEMKNQLEHPELVT